MEEHKISYKKISVNFEVEVPRITLDNGEVLEPRLEGVLSQNDLKSDAENYIEKWLEQNKARSVEANIAYEFKNFMEKCDPNPKWDENDEHAQKSVVYTLSKKIALEGKVTTSHLYFLGKTKKELKEEILNAIISNAVMFHSSYFLYGKMKDLLFFLLDTGLFDVNEVTNRSFCNYYNIPFVALFFKHIAIFDDSAESQEIMTKLVKEYGLDFNKIDKTRESETNTMGIFLAKIATRSYLDSYVGDICSARLSYNDYGDGKPDITGITDANVKDAILNHVRPLRAKNEKDRDYWRLVYLRRFTQAVIWAFTLYPEHEIKMSKSSYKNSREFLDSSYFEYGYRQWPETNYYLTPEYTAELIVKEIKEALGILPEPEENKPKASPCVVKEFFNFSRLASLEKN